MPAFQFLWTGLDDQVKHFRRYTKKSLGKKVEKCGFKIDALKYADSIGFFVLALHKLFNIDDLNDLEQAIFELENNKSLILSAESTTLHLWVITVMDILNKHGFNEVQIRTIEK